MSNQSTNEATSAEADLRADRAKQRRARDEQWLDQAVAGDAEAYRHLVDEWTPGAFDRALHRGADERSAAETVVRTFTSLQTELGEGDTSFGSRVMGAIERDVPARPRALGKATRGAKRAAERLTRGTDPAALGADPSISAMCWDALDVLGDRARDITDLHWRHGLASDEIAAATGESIFRVDDIIRKAPQGLGAALRTRLLWAGGKPDHDELTKDLKANNVRLFDSGAVRVIHAHLRACSVCRSRSLIALPAIEVFASIPLVAVPGELERRIAGTAWAPMTAAAAAAAATAVATAVTAPADEPADAHEPETAHEPEPEPERTEPEPALAPEPRPEPAPALQARRPAGSERTESDSDRAGANGSHMAAGTAAAAFLGASAAAASPTLDRPVELTGDSPLTSPAAEAPAPVVEPPAPTVEAPTPAVEAPPPSPPVESTPTPLAALAKTPAPATPTSPVETTSIEALRSGGSAHEPVASRTTEGDGGRPKWLIPACIAAAVAILLGLVVVFTRGGSEPTAIDAGPTVESTTTSRAPSTSSTTTTQPTTTSTAPPTSQAPTTQAPPTTTGGGGQVTTTTRPVAVIANVNYGMAPGTIDINSSDGSVFTWSVTANGPISVTVTGPGVSSGDPNGSATVCLPATSCGIGTHYFSIVAKDADGRQVGAGTAKLIVRD